MKTVTKILIWIVVALVLVLGIWFGVKFYFVLGDGVKAGNLNQVVYKGWVWKTYEGRIIMSGFRGSKSSRGGIQSNEFNFSVDKKAVGYRANGSVYSVADSLMRCSGKNVQVRYREYKGSLPWRGMQHYIVYEILNVSEPSEYTTIPIESE
ncbi:MAG: hypothetical protein K6F58_06725 [Bacteroidales bacterium]|nr:hypothetical protein [Bacteroidales bacterium]